MAPAYAQNGDRSDATGSTTFLLLVCFFFCAIEFVYYNRLCAKALTVLRLFLCLVLM